MIRIRIITKIIGFVAVLCAGVCFLSYVLNFDYGSYSRIMMHELYANGNNTELLLIGASHVNEGINPFIIEEITEKMTFNAGTMSQKPEDTYFLLEDYLECYKPKKILYDLNYLMFQNYKGDSPIRTHIILDYMRNSYVKFDYAAKILKNPIYAFTPISNVIRYKSNWKDMAEIKNNLRIKQTDSYKEYSYELAKFDDQWYVGNGYICTDRKMANYDYQQYPWNDKYINTQQFYYLEKIINLCKEKKCDLIFISVPIHESYIKNQKNYDDIHNIFEDIAYSNNIFYIDFNEIDSREIGIDDSCFRNAQHLNGKGAAIFSEYLAKFLKNNCLI